jgi:hypothetical protein
MKLRTILAMCALMLGGCKIDSKSVDPLQSANGKKFCLDGSQATGKNSCPNPTPGPAPAPAPAPAPTVTTTGAVPSLLPAPWASMATITCPSGQKIFANLGLVCNPRPPVPALSMHGVTFMGEATIADNFDLSATSAVVYSDIANRTTGLWYGGVAAASPDGGGNFRFACLPGHLAKDDPLFFPGQPGVSHLHQFWGNTQTTASSTYQSLRTTGNSTCTNPINGPANRTAYWMPAMLDGAGNVVKPDYISAYYKQRPAGDPACTESGQCIAVPNGLRYAFGYNMETGTGGTTDPSTPVFYMVKWTCNKDDAGNAAIPGSYHTLADMVAAGCPAGSKIFLNFVAPDCWDGKNVDVADHRSNMAYPTRSTPNGFRCPLDHPYWTPNYSGYIVYTADANFVAGKWHLSSDEMFPGAPAGSTVHFDYWEAWSPLVKATWQFYCIDQALNCAGGELGNGTAMNHDDLGPRPTHQLVPLSSI